MGQMTCRQLYSYDALGQRSLSVLAERSHTTTTAWTYTGQTLLSLEASSTDGTGDDGVDARVPLRREVRSVRRRVRIE